MLFKSITIRVRYNETDQMGIVNNANYPTYFEIGRTELFRDIGLAYCDLEKDNILLPVSELYVKYFRSAFYDDVLTVKTILNDMPVSRMKLEYEIANQHGELITTGYTQLAFLNGETKRPMRIPLKIKELLMPFF
ncbi:MAG: acyl-CoA thioesterase [Marinilabiliaceae bacterium]|nr:acyl-CoA thioesterase [Marinilabiliaceae bacterium]